MQFLAFIKKFYRSFIVPPLMNMIYLDFSAKLTRKGYIIFWLSVVIFSICAVVIVLQGISLTRWLFRIAFDLRYPRWHLSQIMTLFAFGFLSISAIAIPLFFATTANRFKDCGISAWFLLPLFILMWLCVANIFQFQHIESTLIYIINLVFVLYFVFILLMAILLPSKV